MRQGNDRGTQYRHGIYYHNEEQRAAGEAALAREQARQGAGREVVTELKAAEVFWPAENYHREPAEVPRRARKQAPRA